MPDATPRDTRSADPRHEYTPTQSARVREVVALFSDVSALEHAVEDLLTHGFDHGDLSVLASEKVVHERLGHRIEDMSIAADDPDLPRRSWVEPEARMEGRGALASILGYFGAVTALGLTFATGGAAALAIGAAALGAGAGAGVGVGLGKLFDQRLVREFESQLQHGGILLWVRLNEDATCEQRAMDVLNRYGAHHVHVHEHVPT